MSSLLEGGAALYEVDDEEFEQMIQDALLSIPERFRSAIDNVAFVMQEEPDAYQRSRISRGTSDHVRKELLGLYSGIALTRRGAYYGTGNTQPDIITIFKGPHMRVSRSAEDLHERVRKTVVHEVGHYFGMDEQQLRDMGYGSD